MSETRSAQITEAGQPRAEEIANILRDEILLGQYRVGERLPSERDLAGRFSVNRGSVREAIKILTQLGIVTVQPGGVRIVALEDATLGILGPLLDLRPAHSPDIVIDLIEVFGALLALSARLALQKATAGQKANLLNILLPSEHSGAPASLTTDGQDATQTDTFVELCGALNDINDNLVLRLIGNGLRTQILGRLERRHDESSSRTFFRTLASAIQDDDAYGLAHAITTRFDDIKLQVKTMETRPQNHLDRDIAHA